MIFGKNYSSLMLPYHVLHYSKSGLQKILEQGGFKEIKIKTLGQSSVFLCSLGSYFEEIGFLAGSKICKSALLGKILQPIWGFFGLLGFGEELMAIAERAN